MRDNSTCVLRLTSARFSLLLNASNRGADFDASAAFRKAAKNNAMAAQTSLSSAIQELTCAAWIWRRICRPSACVASSQPRPLAIRS
eukprot:scaffold645_cov247-Pinguiococcus_pyrenoidosus.AAC.2